MSQAASQPVEAKMELAIIKFAYNLFPAKLKKVNKWDLRLLLGSAVGK